MATISASLTLPLQTVTSLASSNGRINCFFNRALNFGSFSVRNPVLLQPRVRLRSGGEEIENVPIVDDESTDSQSVDTDDRKVRQKRVKLPERDFAGTAYVPVFVMLPLGVIDMNCELVDPDDLLEQLKILKAVNVDGIMVDCWWGIVEAHAPQQYNWSGYKRLFHLVL